jgi:hypothetical protein
MQTHYFDHSRFYSFIICKMSLAHLFQKLTVGMQYDSVCKTLTVNKPLLTSHSLLLLILLPLLFLRFLIIVSLFFDLSYQFKVKPPGLHAKLILYQQQQNKTDFLKYSFKSS